MKDELSPLSGGGRNTFGGWAASLVDALDTLHIMDMTADFDDAVEAAASVDFSTSTDETVNVFETTIRYLGGYLAAYDLSGRPILLDKAVEVGEMLLIAFDTPNHMPITRWDWRSAQKGNSQVAPDGTLVSELGSLSLEFTRLSQVTGDMRWFDATERITELFVSQQNQTHLPGMRPVIVNPRDEILTSDTGFTLGGMSDSLYEYFPKMFALLGGRTPHYQTLYEGSMAAAQEHLFFRPMTPQNKDVLISGNVHVSNGVIELEAQWQHLGCFVGGMLALGGRLFSHTTDVELGRKIVDGCTWAYNATRLGLCQKHSIWCHVTSPPLAFGTTKLTRMRHSEKPGSTP